jgi:tetratricopeptide (TPR) repeat protein
MSLVFGTLLLLSASAHEAPTITEARSRWLHGNYEEAQALYESLCDNFKNPTAVIGISRCLESRGEYDRALDTVQRGLQANPQSADLLARQSELLYQRGRWEEASQSIEKALAAKPDHFLARWVRSQIYRDQGDWNKADNELRWFVRTYSEQSGQRNEIKDPEILLLVGMAGAENARWHKMADQFRIVLNDVFGDAVRNDKNFWPAEYQAGVLLLEKYNEAQALESFDKALAINPHAAEAFVGKGNAALEKYEIRDAELFARRALAINRNLPEARRLMADVHLLAGDLNAARKELEAARKVNPRDEYTLGRIAACLYLVRDKNTFDVVVKETAQHNPRPAIFYYILASALERRKSYDDAEKYYKEAMKLQPWLPWPQNSLGLIYMRLGREKEAQAILSEAMKADEFNVRVSNSLRVLQHLEKYETTRSDHFLVRFDPQNDRRLPRYMMSYLEKVYCDLSEKFRYRPDTPILVEIFNDHEMFSGRIAALPDLHTIGASTGRMVAMVSPYGRGIRRPFNWARVLRHELVHIFNLEQTHFQAPHWLTEGLAVIQEGFPRPQEWTQLLAVRVPAGEIMNLDTIDLGFIRPRSPLDWHMAYCQSQLYVEYATKQYGAEAIRQMLAAYRDGLDTRAAILKSCHVEKNAFEKGYREYLRQVSRPLRSNINEKLLSYRQLQRELEKKPEDPDLCAQMAEQCLVRGDKKEAKRLADLVLARNKSHPLASYVKSRLLLDAGEDDQARSLLEAVLDRENPDLRVLQELGKLYYESKEFAKAASLYERAHQRQPYEAKWLVQLLRIHTQTGNKAEQIRTLKQLAPIDGDDLDTRKKLARMLSDAGELSQAELYAREVLEIDVRDAEAKEILLKSLAMQNRQDEADRIRKLLAE